MCAADRTAASCLAELEEALVAARATQEQLAAQAKASKGGPAEDQVGHQKLGNIGFKRVENKCCCDA